MRIVAERKDMAKAVGLALLASGKASKDAALSNVLIRMNGPEGAASVESYDTHVYSRASFAAQGDSGELAVEGSRLDHLISTADDGPIELETDADGITAKYGRASIKLRTFPIEKYVRFTTQGEVQNAQGVRSGILLHALEFVRPFVGKDTQKPTQMLAELRNGRFMAGDGVRIGAVSSNLLTFRLKIPQAVMASVARWLKDGTAFTDSEGETVEGMIDVSETQDFYLFRTSSGSSHFAWRKPEHEFMQVEKYLDELEKDAPEAIQFKVDQTSLQRMVDSLSVVLEAGAEKIGFNMESSGQTMLIGQAQDSRGVLSRNQVQIVFPEGKMPSNGDSNFAIRYSHLLETLKLMTNPVVSCNVRRDKSILRIAESHPEMSKMALLTLMQEV